MTSHDLFLFQGHIGERSGDHSTVTGLYPDHKSAADVYDKTGILTPRVNIIQQDAHYDTKGKYYLRMTDIWHQGQILHDNSGILTPWLYIFTINPCTAELFVSIFIHLKL